MQAAPRHRATPPGFPTSREPRATGTSVRQAPLLCSAPRIRRAWRLVALVACALHGLVALLAPALHAQATKPADTSRSGPNDLVWLNDTELAVAAQTRNCLEIVDASTGAVRATVPLTGPANGVVMAGPRLLATAGGPQGTAVLVDARTGAAQATFPVGHTPVSPVADSAGQRAWVCSRHTGELIELDLKRASVRRTLPVGRQPVAAGLTPDEKTLVVAAHLPEQALTSDLVAASVTFVDLATWQVTGRVLLPNGGMSVRGLGLSPDGRFAYVTHLVGRYQSPTTRVDRGWMNTNAVTIIDVPRRARVDTVLLDSPSRGSANPWGVACSPDGQHLLVSCAGSHELVVINRPALHEALEKRAAAGLPSAVDDLSFLGPLSRHVTLSPGNGPRGLAVRGRSLAIALHFSDEIACYDLGDGKLLKPLALPTAPETIERLGERLFNDARHCYQSWQSCASCHPDARVDSLNWDLLNDGLGNPKNTKSLVRSVQTPPMMSLGIREDASHAIRAGFRYIQFHPISEPDADAVLAYLTALPPERSPRAGDPLVEKGKQLFLARGCADCHAGPEFTDRKLHDVGTAPQPNGDSRYDTPTLIEIWRSAPYLHDGSAATLKDVLTTFNPHQRHGDLEGVSAKELEALIAYIESL